MFAAGDRGSTGAGADRGGVDTGPGRGGVWGRRVGHVGADLVIAAGGIADGRGLAAILLLGAQAGWLGTRFLTAVEAHTHDEYRQQLIAAVGEDAVHTLCFDGSWPGAAHRAIRNSTLAAWESADRPAAPGRPGEGDVVAVDTAGGEHLGYGDLMPLPGMRGDLEALALYAGQSAGLVTDIAPADQIVARLVAEALAALNRGAPLPKAVR